MIQFSECEWISNFADHIRHVVSKDPERLRVPTINLDLKGPHSLEKI